ncbi:phytoene desaturase family protein [Microbacterium sp. YY-01]|uniref:phytoene desaturase family protein n=1 Tax=Microbacterium sp. YY-01 TaxID=3421634 RepID=UPI003D166EA8
MPRATIIGSGPNGLSAAVCLARAGYRVHIIEASDTVGGGVRTLPLTLPGFQHDVCSAVHPAAASEFFRAFGLQNRIKWITPDISYAHPLDRGEAAIAWRDIERTASQLGSDGRAWQRLLAPLSEAIEAVADFTGNSLLRVPRQPVRAAQFGLRTLAQGTALARHTFRGDHAAALLSGVIAHAAARLPSPAAAAAGLLLAAHAHAGGWPFPHGGAQSIADALLDDVIAHGGTIETSRRIDDIAALDWGDASRGDLLMLNTSPRVLLGHPSLPARYARAIARYRYGTAAAKVDYALDGPVPWQHPDVALSPTVHLGGTRDEIWAAENAVAAGHIPEQPYVLAVQPSTLDDSRAPENHSVLWAYMHVPHGYPGDPTEAITAQVERFAPGFRDRIVAHAATPASEREAINPAEIGGDIYGGGFTLRQAVQRPVVSATPWRTPLRGVYLASAATPPGPGITGMPGWHAARTALHDAGERVGLTDLFGAR